MLLARPAGDVAREIGPDTDIAAARWIDLIDPSDQEITVAAARLGIHIPTRTELDEIESSSRHYERDGCLYLSTPLVEILDTVTSTRPVGFILAGDRLVTVRYTDYASFDTVGTRIAHRPAPAAPSKNPAAAEILIELVEEIINRLADLLEALGRTLDTTSRRVFNAERPKERARAGTMLRETLRRLGNAGDLASMIHDSLLGVDRARIYFADYLGTSAHRTALQSPPAPDGTTAPPPAAHDAAKDLHARLKLAGRDIASLNDYDSQITGKVRFLLDATLGFISIEQNDGMKVLTVVSSIGITPTLIAGIYGMNFKDMPELSWRYGYAYGLSMMVLTTLLPLLWFWKRGWFGTR